MFLLLLMILTSSATGDWFNRFLRFPASPSVDNYVITRLGMEDLQTAISICAWVKPWHTGNPWGVWFSYEAPSAPNEIVMSDSLTDGAFIRFFNDLLAGSVRLERGTWSHQCVTWDLVTTLRMIYVNGELSASKAMAAGRSIRTG